MPDDHEFLISERTFLHVGLILLKFTMDLKRIRGQQAEQAAKLKAVQESNLRWFFHDPPGGPFLDTTPLVK